MLDNDQEAEPARSALHSGLFPRALTAGTMVARSAVNGPAIEQLSPIDRGDGAAFITGQVLAVSGGLTMAG